MTTKTMPGGYSGGNQALPFRVVNGSPHGGIGEIAMVTEADPIVGNWYQHLDKGQCFEVVAVDQDEGIVEIQTFDGDLEAIGLDDWYDLDLELIEEPEDWTGPLDDIERDDLGYSETDMEPSDWAQPLQEIRTPEEHGGENEGEED